MFKIFNTIFVNTRYFRIFCFQQVVAVNFVLQIKKENAYDDMIS